MGGVETASGRLVRTWLVDAEGMPSKPLSTMVDGYGYWSPNVPLKSCAGLTLRLQAIGRRDTEAALTQPACEVKPVPTVVLAEEGPEEVYLPLALQGRRSIVATCIFVVNPGRRRPTASLGAGRRGEVVT